MSYQRRYRGRNSRSNNTNRSRGNGRNNATFDPSHLVRQSQSQPTTDVKPYQAQHDFADFGFESQLTAAISYKGYSTPTPIQDQAIPHIIDKKDVIGLAGTGTGKTAAFLLPLVNEVVLDSTKRVLIVAPTRELAVQIRDELKSFTEKSSIYSTLCIGGVPLHRQEKMLQRNPQFVIGTPGRIIDLEKRNRLSFSTFNSVVLDEMDRMLDMGFIPDATYIIDRLPAKKQALFFSATMPDKLQSLVQRFMQRPITIKVAKQSAAETVEQKIINTNASSKTSVLHDLLSQPEFEKVLVFGRTKRGLNKLASILSKRGIRIALIHGNKSQNQRQHALQQFRDNKVQALLATDVASRGLDIDDVTHVINYDLPQTEEDYIHRIGRTGRAKKTGIALTFIG